MISGGYYGDGFYPPRHDPAGGNPVNVHVNLSDLQAPKQNANSNDNANGNHNANSNDNSQAGPPGWHQHNPQVQGVNYGSQTGPPGWRQYNPQVHGGNYIPNGYYNSQTGGSDYNHKFKGVTK
ncbi:hypothetical protein MRB53_015210 [Persea americana]|uniref:Uncharacterized protein n=1 Tax=Persea americana TaxID=3435 RepID=A0ACC2KD42_PERAE|nr:hypothetical protein MRB53_015210 [Persea americana]